MEEQNQQPTPHPENTRNVKSMIINLIITLFLIIVFILEVVGESVECVDLTFSLVSLGISILLFVLITISYYKNILVRFRAPLYTVAVLAFIFYFGTLGWFGCAADVTGA